MELVLGHNLISGVPLSNPLKKYYQYVLFQTTVVEKSGLWYYENKGIGKSDADIQIKDTQVLTLDGIITIGFDDLSGITIVDYIGTSIPSINANNIETTVGYLSYFELSTGDKFYLHESKDDKIYGTNGLIGTLSDATSVWVNRRDDVYPYGIALGGSLFQNDTDDEYLRIVGTDITSVIGYTKISQILPKNFWNTGNTLLQVSGDAGLFALSKAYSLGWYGADLDTPLAVDWDTINVYKSYPEFILDNNESSVLRLKLKEIQDLFQTVPINYENTQIFENQVNNNADVQITNIQSLSFNGDCYAKKVVGVANCPQPTNTISNTIHFISDDIPTVNETLFSFTSSLSTSNYYALYIGVDGLLNLKINSTQGINYQKLSFGLNYNDGKNHIIEHSYNNGTITLIVDGWTWIDGESLAILFNGNHYDQIALGNLQRVENNKLWDFNGLLNYFKQDGYCELTMQEGNDDILYDSLNGNNFDMFDFTTAWDVKRNVFAYLYTLGFTAFEDDGDSSILRVPYINENPHADIPGYTRLQNYPTPTGFVKYADYKVKQYSEVNLVIGGGQSNWGGKNRIYQIPQNLRIEQNNIFIWNGSDFDNYDASVNEFSGVQPYLLTQMRDYINQPIYFQETWQGGTMLEQGGSPYPSFPIQTWLDDSLAAYNKLKESNVTGIRIHIFWIQGYSDAQNEAVSLLYETNLRNLFESLRSQFGSNVKIHFNQLNINANGDYVANVRTAQNTVAGENALNVIYDWDSLTMKIDGAHYEPEAYEDGADLFYNGSKDDLQGTTIGVKDVNQIKDLSSTYELGLFDINGNPNEISYSDMLSLNIIPKEDFRLTKAEDGSYIKDMASQPYEKLFDINGDLIKDINGDQVYVIKEF